MSSTWPEDLGTEYDEYDDAELYDDSEAYDDAEASLADRRRRARRVALARRRATQRRSTRLPATTRPRPATQQVASAVRDLDLESKVAQDSFRSAIAAQNKRMSRAEYATVASVLVNQFIQSFDGPKNQFARAALQAAPLALLSPKRHGTGVEAVIKDPRIIGGAGVLGLVLLGEQRNRTTSVRQISILGPDELVSKDQDTFLADVLDSGGRPITTAAPTWKSSRPGVASIDPTTGDVEALAPGVTVITATADDVVGRARLKVIGWMAGGTGKLTEGADAEAAETNAAAEEANLPAKKAVSAKKAVPAKKATVKKAIGR